MTQHKSWILINDVPMNPGLDFPAEMDTTRVKSVVIENVQHFLPLLVWAVRCRTTHIILRGLTINTQDFIDISQDRLKFLSDVQRGGYNVILEDCNIVMKNADDWEKILEKIFMRNPNTRIELYSIRFKIDGDVTSFINIGANAIINASAAGLRGHNSVITTAFDDRVRENHSLQTTLSKRINVNEQ